ncbi:MAG: hypothetical protein JSR96_11140 [Proteobacteria bacterium]|nr:hypothetical protein [Pseudomonadota bacterium]
MISHDPRTLAFYASEAPDYHARSKGGVNHDLSGFLDWLSPGRAILELGCQRNRAQGRLDQPRQRA